MRLRHKKPINPYIGQVNHDSSSLQDEDFEKNHTPSRRQKFVKPKPVTEQTKKYAEILLDFTAVVNQNFRNHVKKTGCTPHSQAGKDKIEPNLALLGKQNIFVEDQVHGKTEVVSKQQQKIRKSESLSQKLPPYTKKIRKERPPVEQPPKKREVREPPIQRPNPLPQQTKPTHLIDLTSNQKTQQIPTFPPKAPSAPNPQNIFQNPFANVMNPAMFNPMMLQMAMMNYQNQPDFKSDPNIMAYMAQVQNMFGMFPMAMQNMQGGQNGYIPFKQLPFLNNEGKQAFSRQLKQFQEAQQQAYKKAEQLQNQSNAQKVANFQADAIRRVPPPAQPPVQPLQKPEIPRVKKTETELTPNKKIPSFPQIPVSNRKQPEPIRVQLPKQPLNQNVQKLSTPSLPNFNRRASNHVSIAYNIHFHHLRQKNLINSNLSQMKSPEDLKIIDPTYPARKIRQRKNSDNVTGIHKPCDFPPS